jgi:hypothetical protein
VVILVTAIVASMTTVIEPSQAAETGVATEATTAPSHGPNDYLTGSDGLALPGLLTADDRLPAGVQPLPVGRLASALEGWALGIYDVRTTVYADEGSEVDEGPIVLYVGNPQGEYFQVLELARGYEYELIRWRPPETTAIIALWEEGSREAEEAPPPPLYQQLDLLTGEFTDPHFGPLAAPYMQYLGPVSGSEELWLLSDEEPDDPSTPTQRLVVWHNAGVVRVLHEFATPSSVTNLLVNPSMDRVAITTYTSPTVVVEIASGEVKTFDPNLDPARHCEDIGWYDDVTLVRSCVSFTEYDEHGSLEKFSVWSNRSLGPILTYDTAAGEYLTFGYQAVRVGEHIIHPMAAPEADYECRDVPFYVDDNDYYTTGWVARRGEPQDQQYIFHVVSRKAYAATIGSCPSRPFVREVSVLDTDTNTTTVIFPRISVERGEQPETPGLVSVIVGTK